MGSIPIWTADPLHIEEAAKLIQEGNIIAYPTETVYGLAVDALNPKAVEYLAQIKGRNTDHVFPLIVAHISMVYDLVSFISESAFKLMAIHWPGPLTLVLPAAPGLPQGIVGHRGLVGLRISSDPIAHALVKRVGRPITATSANLTNQPTATTAFDVKMKGILAVLDGGPRCNQPSTVIQIIDYPVLLRKGATQVEGL